MNNDGELNNDVIRYNKTFEMLMEFDKEVLANYIAVNMLFCEK